MQYTRHSFTLPVNSNRISQLDYEIAVGLRCPKCRTLLTPKAHKCQNK